ncbi:ankyrin repeat and sam domain-containing protein 3 [Plakobranchus ocellatus]|uniref:Ankyrin repeat and sam domain-containing protein 3 n=1 Tax=Plakobranchus ocellatus TaxID=259542 RepID=A0AAV3YFF5_9GAST|nr:ankyrin repeat and sam domain-containing protein 3 [Plakobranchus ocellatus]
MEAEDTVSSIWMNSSTLSSPRAYVSPMECPLPPSKSCLLSPTEKPQGPPPSSLSSSLPSYPFTPNVVVTGEFDDYNDESNAFTKTGAITIKSSSSSSGGLMAALGLSLDSEDSHCSASGKFDDDNQALQPSVRNQTTSGKDFVEENEQQEYDVDGDSSRPLDSHSPSLNDTSSLSSSDQKQRSNNIGETNPKQPTCNSNVSLKDYFPLDLSFPPGHTDYPHETQEGVQNEAGKPPGKMKLVSKVDGYLPKENMSQSEIVNRFLDNLTLTDSGIENHGSGDCLHSVPETEDSCEITQNNKDSQDPLIARQCIRPEELRILEGSERNKNESAKNMLKELSSTAYVKPVSKQQHFFSDNNTNETFSYPTQLSPASANQSQPQQWAPHPPLNHHHPLHNRHKHHQYYGGRALPVSQDVKSNMYDILTSPNSLKLTSQKQPGINLPYLGNLPQQFIFSDLNSSPFAHMQANFNQNPYQSLTTEGNMVANIQQLYSNDNVNQHFHTSTTLPPSATAAQTSKGINQSVHAISGWSTDDPLDGLSNALQPMLQTPISLPPVIEQPPPLPALTHLPPVCASGAPSPSVVIPGHFTSQPISVPQALNSAIRTPPNDEGPQDIKDMLSQLGLLKYLDKFEEQDVDLQVFLSLTDNDLKELGIKLFGPRKKMTNAIARWHSNAPAAKNSLEQAYADKLEGEMQEMAIQLNQAYENEERLKALVSQEQQLRSVTESCLMEERSGWEQACQMLQTTRGKLRTLGEQQSRLRHYQKELRKQFEAWMTEAGDNNSNGGQRRGKNSNINSHEFNTHTVDGTRAGESSNTDDAGSVKSCEITTCHNSSMGPKVRAAAEQMKRSDKCLKEMMQTLSTLVLNTDHILKSMQSLGSMKRGQNYHPIDLGVKMSVKTDPMSNFVQVTAMTPQCVNTPNANT